MKTIEIIKHTGEMETVQQESTDENGDPITVEQEITEQVKTYTCNDGEENDLLQRAKLKAEDYAQETGYQHDARIVE